MACVIFQGLMTWLLGDCRNILCKYLTNDQMMVGCPDVAFSFTFKVVQCRNFCNRFTMVYQDPPDKCQQYYQLAVKFTLETLSIFLGLKFAEDYVTDQGWYYYDSGKILIGFGYVIAAVYCICLLAHDYIRFRREDVFIPLRVFIAIGSIVGIAVFFIHIGWVYDNGFETIEWSLSIAGAMLVWFTNLIAVFKNQPMLTFVKNEHADNALSAVDMVNQLC